LLVLMQIAGGFLERPFGIFNSAAGRGAGLCGGLEYFE
jgi:hypothetical protein